MNVCIINPNFYRSSGVTVAIDRLIGGSVGETDIQWHLINCKYGDSGIIDDPNWKHKTLASSRSFKLMAANPIRLAVEAWKFRKYLKHNNIKVVHTHHRRLALVVGLATMGMNVGRVYTAHLSYGRSKIPYLFNTNEIISISKSVSEDLRDYLNISNSKLIPNATPFHELTAVQTPISRRYVLCIGRLDEVKNHKMLLAAWAMIDASKRARRLVILGEGKLLHTLQAQCNKLNIADSVIFAGYQSDVAKYIDQCLFLVLTSHTEGLPIALLEGAARARASLVTNVSGSRDCVLKESTLPNLCPPDDPVQFAELLNTWLDNPDQVTREGMRCFDYWKSICAPSVVAREHEKIYIKSTGPRGDCISHHPD